MFEPFVLSLSKHTPPFDRALLSIAEGLKTNGNLKLHKAESIIGRPALKITLCPIVSIATFDDRKLEFCAVH